ncbi:DUF881 domain-containing protein [Cellulosimicrobium terreum]|nr:DUF881 domain-containing protein [Cellulosimicrobium terreum]
MTLLNEVMHRPLDPGYAEVAARRAAGLEPRRRSAGVAVLVTLAVVLGLATTAAAVDLRAPRPDAIAARDVLEQEIIKRQDDADGLVTRSDDLSAEVEQLQGEALAGVDDGMLADLAREGAVTGTRAVEGPGLVVTLTDATSDLAPGELPDSESRVQDSDLQQVVNALWSGGAEAIAINGQRLGGLSAIRSAGDAILVDLQPLVAPYKVEAVGDADAMQAALVRSGVSDLLRILGSRYGILSSVITQSRLELPGSPDPSLYFATVPGATVESDPSTAPDATTRTMPGTEPDPVPGTRRGAQTGQEAETGQENSG